MPLVQDPKKEGLKPRYKYLNGHNAVVVVFANDSLCDYDAVEIKGYYRKQHGKSFLSDGHFESVLYSWNGRESSMAFHDRLFKGTYAVLYRI